MFQDNWIVGTWKWVKFELPDLNHTNKQTNRVSKLNKIV